jgi:hypothetical protein
MLTLQDIVDGHAYAGPIVAEFDDMTEAGAFQKLQGTGYTVTGGVQKLYAVRKIVRSAVDVVDCEVIRCMHDGDTIKRLPPVDPRENPLLSDVRLAFKSVRARRWLEQQQASKAASNVIPFGSLAK